MTSFGVLLSPTPPTARRAVRRYFVGMIRLGPTLHSEVIVRVVVGFARTGDGIKSPAGQPLRTSLFITIQARGYQIKDFSHAPLIIFIVRPWGDIHCGLGGWLVVVKYVTGESVVPRAAVVKKKETKYAKAFLLASAHALFFIGFHAHPHAHPHTLTPSHPHTLPSHPHSLTPSLTHSLTRSLSHSLSETAGAGRGLTVGWGTRMLIGALQSDVSRPQGELQRDVPHHCPATST